VTGAIPGAVHEAKNLAGFGERNEQRMIAPRALVGDVHPRFALAGGHHQRTVQVDRRPVEELLGLLGPDVQPRVVDGPHETADVALGEAAAEVAGGGGIGNPLGPQGVEEDLVGFPRIDIAAQQIINGRRGDAEGFVIAGRADVGRPREGAASRAHTRRP